LSQPANAQTTQKQDAWKQAGADNNLRQAFERALYALKDSGHGLWRGSNDAQKLSIEFDAKEARLKHPMGSVGFHLAGYGYGEALQAPVAPILHADGTRLEYRRGDLTEWYVNERQGLEQGFTFQRKPTGAAQGQPLTIALDVTGDLALSQQDGAILLKSGKAVVLRYADLTAVDARGRKLPARMEARNGQIRMTVEDQNAQYPLTVDPTWSQQQELTASDGTYNDNFGYSVSVSGTIAVIGAPYHSADYLQRDAGTAYIFVQNSGAWTLEAELTASDSRRGSDFGYSVSVSGTTAVIGAPYYDANGAAYVFVQSGSTWTQQAELTASDEGYGDEFGTSVSMSGTTVVIGAPNRTVAGKSEAGAAYIFTQKDSTWSQQVELTASDGASSDFFGTSVSVSGTTVVIGELNRNVGSDWGPGAAYVFVQSGSTWTQQAELTASDGTSTDLFGTSVSVSGTTAVIGAPHHRVGCCTYSGAAYAFVQSGSTWSQQAELTPKDGADHDYFGTSVSLSGTTAVIGAPGDGFSSLTYAGAVYVFTQNGSSWSQQAELTAIDGAAGDYFGDSVSLSGITAVIGADAHAVSGYTGQGSSYVFVVEPTVTKTAVTSSLTPSHYGQSVTFTATVKPAAAAGTVQFSVDGSNAGSAVTLTAGSATYTTRALTARSHSIEAAYIPATDSVYAASSGSMTQVVSKATTTTALTSSLNPSVYGQTLQLVAAVTGQYGKIATGTVTFNDGSKSLGSATLSGGKAALTTTALSVGTKTITVVYSGDTNFAGSTSNKVSQVVSQATTTTTLASSKNPSSYLQSVTFTATISGKFGGTASGTVTFKDGTTALKTVSLSGGAAKFTTTALALGTHSITAVYSGDTNFAASKSTAVSQGVNKAISTTTLKSSLNPSNYPQSVTFTATISGQFGGTATGTVTFKNGTTALKTVSVSGGKAVLTTTTLPAGTDSITAVYSGDANFAGSTSNKLSQVVNKATTTTALTSSLNPSIVGQTVKLTATVSGKFGGTATGKVTFSNGSKSLGTATLSGGKAVLTTTALPAGTDSITAAYGGDTNFSGSKSSALNQVVKAGAALTSPKQGAAFTSASQKFIWTTPTGATSYSLLVGSTGPGSGNLYYKDTQADTLTANNLPVNGETLYVRLRTSFNGVVTYSDYTFTAFTKK
jgi:hypothetical protein